MSKSLSPSMSRISFFRRQQPRKNWKILSAVSHLLVVLSNFHVALTSWTKMFSQNYFDVLSWKKIWKLILSKTRNECCPMQGMFGDFTPLNQITKKKYVCVWGCVSSRGCWHTLLWVNHFCGYDFVAYRVHWRKYFTLAFKILNRFQCNLLERIFIRIDRWSLK